MKRQRLINGVVGSGPAAEAFLRQFEVDVETAIKQVETWMEQGRMPSDQEFIRAQSGYYDLCDSLRATAYSRGLDKYEQSLVRFCRTLAERFNCVDVAPLPEI